MQVFIAYILTAGCALLCVSDGCVDKLPDCADFTLNACKAPFVNWAHANCPAFCVFCRRECQNKRTDCREYGQQMCQAPYTSWAKKNCEEYCGFCGRDWKCVYSPWFDLTPCPKTCNNDGKLQVRKYTLVPHDTPLADNCDKSLLRRKKCNNSHCTTPTLTTTLVHDPLVDVNLAPIVAGIATGVGAGVAGAASIEAGVGAGVAGAASIEAGIGAGIAGATAIEAGVAGVAAVEAGVAASATILEFLPLLLGFFGKRNVNEQTRALENLVLANLENQSIK
ncbi:uncharacterized protein LOC128173192 isoform X4 [Crassostrea angulata]|uniref:uncharacterized protein LOC128173192 isoform X4 n=1 Tax=Magallana angulata TaxID=2784310 RepID=UPI0022B1439E|nr:uncharacterized protein LOC128173192 isoform X4 [Crassostrea angulata]